jgi:hypothetical protein
MKYEELELVQRRRLFQEPRWFGGGGSSSSAYSRKGTGTHDRSYAVPDGISSLISNNAQNAAVDPTLGAAQSSKYKGLMAETSEKQAGFSQLVNAANTDPSTFIGKDALTKVASQDPYSGAFEAQTEGAYRQRAADAMSQAATGPDAVRGGEARTGIAQGVMANQLARERGAEVRQARVQDVGQVIGAAGGAADIEGKRLQNVTLASQGLSGLQSGVAQRGLEAAKGVDFNKLNNLQMLQLASTLQGVTKDVQKDDFTGQGDQQGFQAGLSCCFIVLEATNGEMPWFVELARVEMWTPARRAGYKWMAGWLVPLMRRFSWVKGFVNTVMVKPILNYGAWFYGEPVRKRAMSEPLCSFWFAVWSTIGRKTR